MRLRVLGAAGVAAAAAVVVMLGAGSALADGFPFDALTGDIQGSFLPAVQETSFLRRVTLAEKYLFPSNRAFPPSPCSATAQLDSIGFSAQGLLAGGHIDSEAESAIIRDVTSANDWIVYGSSDYYYPPSPCHVAFLASVSSGG